MTNVIRNVGYVVNYQAYSFCISIYVVTAND